MRIIEEVTFEEDFRCFSKGEKIKLRKGINILVGENGSGKSSFFKVLADKSFRDKAIIKLKEGINRETLNFIFHDFEKMNPRVRGYVESRAQIASIFKSHGEVNIVILKSLSKIKNTPIILMDEPESALSISKTIEICRFLKTIEKENKSQIILSTHNPIFMCMTGMVLDFTNKPIKWRTTRDFLKQYMSIELKLLGDILYEVPSYY